MVNVITKPQDVQAARMREHQLRTGHQASADRCVDCLYTGSVPVGFECATCGDTHRRHI